jgi:hypothetical protein
MHALAKHWPPEGALPAAVAGAPVQSSAVAPETHSHFPDAPHSTSFSTSGLSSGLATTQSLEQKQGAPRPCDPAVWQQMEDVPSLFAGVPQYFDVQSDSQLTPPQGEPAACGVFHMQPPAVPCVEGLSLLQPPSQSANVIQVKATAHAIAPGARILPLVMATPPGRRISKRLQPPSSPPRRPWVKPVESRGEPTTPRLRPLQRLANGAPRAWGRESVCEGRASRSPRLSLPVRKPLLLWP